MNTFDVIEVMVLVAIIAFGAGVGLVIVLDRAGTLGVWRNRK